MERLSSYIKMGLVLGPYLYLFGCTEPFAIETVGLERILVVEATITDEMKRQRVTLTRTIGLEEFGRDVVENAEVKIMASNGANFNFSLQAGTNYYISDEEFKALPELEYRLNIVTQDNQRYSSSAVTLPPVVALDQVYTELIDEPGKEGIQVLVDAENSTDAQYFRYEYEETYKVTLPHPSPFRSRILQF